MKTYRITSRGRTVIVFAALLMIFTTFQIVRGKNIEDSNIGGKSTFLIKDVIYDKKIMNSIITNKLSNSESILVINFDINSSRIDPSNYKSLNLLVNILKIYDNINLEIRGHCSKEPNMDNEAFNQSLSTIRAEEVKKYLVLKGISPNRISIGGYGYSDPIEDNATSLGRKMNRRVEIYFNMEL